MQKKLTNGPLLDAQGNLAEAGYAFRLLRTYDRSAIKAGALRIKEWDYYFVSNGHIGLALTVADNAYMALASVTFFDFDVPREVTKSPMRFFTFGKLHLPSSSTGGTTKMDGKGYSLVFINDGDKRHLVGHMNGMEPGKDLAFDLFLSETNRDTMVIATPFRKKRHFYYNQKVNLLEATGKIRYGEATHDMEGALGVLDWGRGVWPYNNAWYWSSLNAVYQGQRIGFNLGYGFGDTSAASENMVFFNDRAYKVNDVRFEIPHDPKTGKFRYLEDWTFSSEDDAIHLTFHPLLDRHSASSLVIIKSLQHQVFGYFSGYLMAGEEKVTIDHVLGFAEHVMNRW